MKIVTELVAKGFVDGARGKGGGLRHPITHNFR